MYILISYEYRFGMFIAVIHKNYNIIILCYCIKFKNMSVYIVTWKTHLTLENSAVRFNIICYIKRYVKIIRHNTLKI